MGGVIVFSLFCLETGLFVPQPNPHAREANAQTNPFHPSNIERRNERSNNVFNDIPKKISGRMSELERIDSRDRTDGTPRMKRLRQISPEVGKFIAILAATAPAGHWIEIGTSAGYSTLWLALASRAVGRKITTYEILPEKAELARQTFDAAGVSDVVNFVHGDALEYLRRCKDIGFCFLDAEKEIYLQCYEAVVPCMISGGILVADNAINHQATLRPMLGRALQDERVDALVVPIGKGELVCRRK
jgi:predicted O-methyltransferase YrrM